LSYLKKVGQKPKFVLLVNILINIFVGTIKWFGGIFGNSQALLADALETTSDIISSVILLVGYNKSTKAPDLNHPYGHGKLQSLTSFIIGLVLILSVGLIVYESVQSLLLPNKIPPQKFTIYIIVFVIVIKEILYHVFKRVSKVLHSSMFHHEALHHRTDAFTTIITLVGVSFSLFTDGKYWYGDQLAAIMASAIILYNAYRIIRSSVAELMDEQTFPEVSSLIEQIASEMSDIDSYEKCYVRKSGSKFYCDIHIRVSANFSVKKGHDIAHELKDKAQGANFLIEDVHIHVEPTYD
jgi:cation diffusion facilitator family transporter